MPKTLTLKALIDCVPNCEYLNLEKHKDDIVIQGISANSQAIKDSFLFVAKRGATQNSRDGHDFINDAVSRGASAVVVDKSWPKRLLGVPIIVVDDTALALSFFCESFFDWPSRKLKLIGITGTNGKSSTSFMLHSILQAAGFRPAVMGTLGVGDPGSLIASTHTTLDPEYLSAQLSSLLHKNYTHVIMEISSHALAQQRVSALDFSAVGFSNLSQDHLDFHGTMENYRRAKEILFRSLAKVHTARVLPLNHPFDLDKNIKVWLFDPEAKLEISLPFIGDFHKKNALLAKNLALALGINNQDIAAGLSQCQPIPGRLEIVSQYNPRVVIDFAHTPDALSCVLKNLQAITEGDLILVFGCGGDRDQKKRPLMGQIASSLADKIIITDDNPRSENPDFIRAAIIAGMDKQKRENSIEIADRKLAISHAIKSARAKDTVLIAGKGHEDYQVYQDQTKRFSDREEAQSALGEVCKS